MARDISIRLNRCQYCNRPGFVVWDVDLFTCGREVCKSLAFAEVRRRHREGRAPLPEKRLAAALLAALDTFDYALREDEHGDVLTRPEAERIRNRERQETAWLLSELRELERRYPNPPKQAEQKPTELRPNPRVRRFVRRGHTVPLRPIAA
jgi:hypothetical protein